MSEELINQVRELNKIISDLQEKVDKCNTALKSLEDFFSCELCGEVDSLHVCYSCGRKTCKYCNRRLETKDYVGETIIRHYCFLLI